MNPEKESGEKTTSNPAASSVQPPPPTPSMATKSEQDDLESLLCCLCLDDLPMDHSKIGKIVRFSCCGSGIHLECKDEFKNSPMSFEQKNSCPMCRSEVPVTGSKEEIKRLRHWVEKGEVWAMLALGDRYREGVGVTQSHKKAAELYKLAADQGDADAQYNYSIPSEQIYSA